MIWEVVVDGWYKMGDIGFIDDDGFVMIIGRLSCFLKIGGEMVLYIFLEEEMNCLLGVDDEGLFKVVVMVVLDEKKGE